MESKSNNSKRREFIRQTIFATAGTIAVPTILTFCSKKANERIQLAHIGAGSRGTSVTKNYFLNIADSVSLATCDVFAARRENLSKHISAFYKEKYQQNIECIPYLDYEEILARDDIDAVHVSTADYWHLTMAIKSIRASKHIYLEKPLGLSLDDMLKLEIELKRKNLVFQYGTQQRSLGHVEKGVQMVKSGEIGEIHTIDVWAPSAGGKSIGQVKGSIISKNPPAGLDYDRWLGPAPIKPYCEARVANTGIWNLYDYCLGMISSWGAHPLDIAVWGAKEKMKDICTITGSGCLFPEDSFFDTILHWNLNLKYNNGLIINFVSDNFAGEMDQKLKKSSNGTTFYGNKGWISLGRGAAASNIPKLDKDLNVAVYGENNLHGLNFIKTIKGEREEINPLDEAILSDCISHMGNVLIRSGKDKVIWDPVNRKIINYPELINQFFHRESREPYTA